MKRLTNLITTLNEMHNIKARLLDHCFIQCRKIDHFWDVRKCQVNSSFQIIIGEKISPGFIGGVHPSYVGFLPTNPPTGLPLFVERQRSLMERRAPLTVSTSRDKVN